MNPAENDIPASIGESRIVAFVAYNLSIHFFFCDLDT